MKPILNTDRRYALRAASLILLVAVLTITSTRLRADTGSCGGPVVTLPFTDVMGNPFFCDIAEAYFSGLSNGTSPTTYSPSANVPREQMAAFITRTLDQSLRRGSPRAALDQFWTTTPHYTLNLGVTSFASSTLQYVKSDGTDVWVADSSGDRVFRVRASDGDLIGTWTGADAATGVLCAMGRVFVTGHLGSPTGSLYMIDPTAAPGAVTTVATGLDFPSGIGFDGNKIWLGTNTTISIVTPAAAPPWSVTTVSGFVSTRGFVFDGTNMWLAESSGVLKKLDASGNVLQTVTTGALSQLPVFDGRNIWVPNQSANTITVVRPSDGLVLATLSGNGLNSPHAAAFDGERILVANLDGSSVSLWNATDLSPLGTVSMGASTQPNGVCSDGQQFFITLQNVDKLVRF